MSPDRRQGSRRGRRGGRGRSRSDQRPNASAEASTRRPAETGETAVKAGTKPPDEAAPFGALQWTLLIAGVVALIYGFALLSKANPSGDDWASVVSPFLIVGAYATIFVAVVVRSGGKKQ